MTITEQTALSIPTGTWTADPTHSSVTFEVQYLGVSTFSGGVKQIEATLAEGLISGSAAIATLETKDENLRAHLLSPEFFDAERFPRVSFASTAAGGDGDEVAFEGEVTIKGITQPARLTGTVTGPVTDPYGNRRYGVKLETTIDRTLFGITWNNQMPDGSDALAAEVTLKADLSLVETT